ncbi:MAG: DMT family transporter [Candidatus Hodarchaeales archaeon]
MEIKRAHFLMIVAATLWGTTYTAVKIGLSILNPPLPPLGFLFLRFTLALFLIMLPLLSSRNTRIFIKEILVNKFVIYLGVINGLSYVIQFLGQKGTSAGIATLFINLYLVSTPVFAWLVLGETLTGRSVTALIISLIGVGLVSISSLLDVPSGDLTTFIFSSIIVLVSGIVWGGYAVVSKLISNESKKTSSDALSNASSVFLVSNIYSIILIFITMVLLDQPPNFQQLNFPAWATIIYLAIFGTVIPFVLTIQASHSLMANEINILTIWNIVVGIFLAMTILHETFDYLGIVGCILIIYAVYLTSTNNSGQ